MDLAQLNQLLEKQSYIGSESSVTMDDYTKCREIKSVDAGKFPHVARWHAHVTYLAERFPTHDWRGNPIPKGNGIAPSQEKKKEAAPKAAPKEAAPKAKPKEEPKKDKKGADKGKKAEEEKPVEKTPEQLEAEKKAKLKKVIKEGGKRGVEIEGAADMGGLKYFCTSVDEPQGDPNLLEESMKAMNAKSDPSEEERKGGSGHIGKMLFSAGDTQLAILGYVPEANKAELNCGEWMEHVVKMIGGTVVDKAPLRATAVIKADPDKGIFPLKQKDPGIMEAIAFLKKKSLFPDGDDDDDDYVFGDDDFPS